MRPAPVIDPGNVARLESTMHVSLTALFSFLAMMLSVPLLAAPTAAAPPTCLGETVTISGTDGDDDLVGTPGPDVVDAGAGDDVVLGRGGDDLICGGDGDDVLYGGVGDDTIDGGVSTARGDRLIGGANDDRMIGTRTSEVDFRGAPVGVTVDLPGGETPGGTASGDGKDTIEGIGNVIGSPFGDRIDGGEGDNQLVGLGGRDTITTDRGNDEVYPDSRPGLRQRSDRSADRVFSTRDGTVHVTPQGGADRIVARDDTALVVQGDLDEGAVVRGGRRSDRILATGTYSAHGGSDPDALIAHLTDPTDRVAFFGGPGDDELEGATTMDGEADDDDFLLTIPVAGAHLAPVEMRGGTGYDQVTLVDAGPTQVTDRLDLDVRPDGFDYRTEDDPAPDVETSGLENLRVDFSGGPPETRIQGTDRADLSISLDEVYSLAGDLGGGDDRIGVDGFFAFDVDLDLGSGDDVFSARAATYDVRAGPGDDQVSMSLYSGIAGTLTGGPGDDALTGSGRGNDTLLGGAGADLLDGSGGDDDLRGGAGADRADGGDGSDVCVAEEVIGCER